MPPKHPLPSERDRVTQLPSMTAAAVCTRMLRNLWGLHCANSNPYIYRPDRRQLPSRLLPCLLQLGPRFAFDVVATFAWQMTKRADNGGPAEFYVQQLKSLVRVAGKGRGVSGMQRKTPHLWWCVGAQHSCDDSGPQMQLS